MGTYHGGRRAAGPRGGGRWRGRGEAAGSVALVQPGDLRYLGSFLVPVVPSPYEEGSCYGVTHRYVGGAVRLLVNMQTVLPACGVVEVVPPTTLGAGVRGTLGAVLGDPAQGRATAQIFGVTWVEAEQRLYWLQHSRYNTTAPEMGVLGFATLGTVTGATVITGAAGPWAILPAGTGGNRWAKGLTTIPAGWRARFGGRSLLAGFGFCTSIVNSGPQSLGPSMTALFPIDEARDTGGQYQGGVQQLVHHPYDVGKTDPLAAPRYGIRPHADYLNALGGWPKHPGGTQTSAEAGVAWPVEGNAWICENDFGHGGVWVDTGTKHGVLVPCAIRRGAIDSRVVASPTPTPTSFAVAEVGTIQAGDHINIDHGLHRPDYQTGTGNATFMRAAGTVHAGCAYPASAQSQAYGQRAVVAAVSGTTITLTAALWTAPPVGSRVFGAMQYYDGSHLSPRTEMYWLCYDPAVLAASAGAIGAGGTLADRTPWTWAGLIEGFPGGTVQAPQAEPYYDLTFDDVTNRIYAIRGGTISVYEVG